MTNSLSDVLYNVFCLVAAIPLNQPRSTQSNASDGQGGQTKHNCSRHQLQGYNNATQLYVCDKYKFLFCRNPKVAGTSWTLALFRLCSARYAYKKQTIPWKTFIKHMKPLRFFNRSEIQHRLKTYYKFMFVREPLERLLSTYGLFVLKYHNSQVSMAIRRRRKASSKGNVSMQHFIVTEDFASFSHTSVRECCHGDNESL